MLNGITDTIRQFVREINLKRRQELLKIIADYYVSVAIYADRFDSDGYICGGLETPPIPMIEIVYQ